jgi:pilus assembly protein TadC
MIALIGICIIGAIVLIIAALLGERSLRLPSDLKNQNKAVEDKIPSWLKDIFWGFNGVILKRYANRNKLVWQLQTAGVQMQPELYLFIKEVLMVLAVIVLIAYNRKIELWWIPLIIIFSLIIPDMYVTAKRRARNNLIVKVLPDVIDLLYLCVGGGLDFMHGLNWVITRSRKGPLIDELKHVVHEIKMGKTHYVALKDMATYLRIPQVSSFVNTIVHGERMGSPIVEILSTLADDARRQRFQRAERMALSAPIKMIFPLAFFILPIVVIIIAGPVYLKYFKDTGFMK